MLWELAIDAAGIGTFDWDLTTGVLTWDERMLQLSGHTADSFDGTIEGFNARTHPDDLPRVMQTVQGAIEARGDYETEYRVVHPDGTTRWVAARGRALVGERGTSVRVLGAAYDTTVRQEGESRVARVLESMTSAFFSLDRDWRFSYVNAEAERVLGRSRGELLGGDLWELFPAAVGSDFETHYRGAMATGRPTTFDAHYPAPLDAWYEVRAWPTPDGLSVYFLDVTERREAAQRVERAAQRADLLARVTEQLTGTLDAEEAVAHLAQLVVPTLADWCLVSLVDDDEAPGARKGLRDVGAWHADAAMRPVLDRYAQIRLGALPKTSLPYQALGTGRPVVVESGAGTRIQAALTSAEAKDLLGRLDAESAVFLPLRGRGHTVGVLSLFNGPHRAPISPEEVATALDVAGRAGLALDNSRLYRQQRRLAEGLQRSLLTAPAEPDHVQVVVRYVPAAQAAQVGGDWYDSFLQPSGETIIAIGDVLGHDTGAAAAMGQVRSLLRGIAVVTGAGPAEILRGVDLAMVTLQLDTTATAVVAKLEQTPDEQQRGITRIRWSNAGHPPPMAINPDGRVLPLVGLQSDLLLGILPETQRFETEVVLDRGATLLLYTDGLVERRDQSLEQGLLALRTTLGALAAQDLSLDDLSDEVLARMLPAHPEDDVALVAVRLHRQDRPRPEQAGPNRIPPDVEDSPDVVPQPAAGD